MNDFYAGCLGGIVGTFISYPIDTARIRLQSNIKNNKKLYSGILSPMLGIGIEKSFVFGVHNITYKYCENHFISGLNAGLFASLVVVPIEKYKILKQNNPKLTYLDINTNLIKKGPILGVKQLYNGLSACFFREVPGYGIYFTTYDFLNNKFNNNKKNNFVMNYFFGGISGVTAWIFIHPFDTIKTNMQQYETKFFDTTKNIIKNGNIYAGIHWSLLRAFTLHSSVFLTYELSIRYLF